MTEFNDLREWLELAGKMGELKTLEGADPHLEVGTMVQINGQNQGPALLFDKFRGYGEWHSQGRRIRKSDRAAERSPTFICSAQLFGQRVGLRR